MCLSNCLINELITPALKMNLAFLTSYPLDVRVGSGVIQTLVGWKRALRDINISATLITSRISAGSMLALANGRLQFNRELSRRHFDSFDALIGSDFDGYALPLEKTPPYFVFNGGLLADIVGFEHGRSAKILRHLACREQQNLQKALAVFVPSRYSARRLHQLYGISRSKIRILPLGIDYPKWKQMLDRSETMPTGKKNILCVARQYPRKGISDLIKAFKILLDRLPHCRLQLAGSGPQMQANRRLAAKLGISGSVIFHGDITDRTKLAALYKNSDVFCLPSYHETFGLVYLEAMASGLPVVAYRTTAVPEVVHPEAGMLVPAGDINQLTEKLYFLLNHPQLRQNLGRAGETFAQKMSWTASAKKMIQYIQDIINPV